MKFYIKQKVLSLKQDFDIYDSQGRAIYHVDDKLFALGREQKVIDCHTSQVVATVKQKLLVLLPTFNVYVNGQLVESIRQKLTLIRNKLELKRLGWKVEGDFLDYNYRIKNRQNQTLCQVTKKILAWSDTFEINVLSEEVPPVMVVAIALAIDMIHDQTKK